MFANDHYFSHIKFLTVADDCGLAPLCLKTHLIVFFEANRFPKKNVTSRLTRNFKGMCKPQASEVHQIFWKHTRKVRVKWPCQSEHVNQRMSWLVIVTSCIARLLISRQHEECFYPKTFDNQPLSEQLKKCMNLAKAQWFLQKVGAVPRRSQPH